MLAGRVFTRAEAEDLGVSAGLFRSPVVRRVWPGVYADAALADGPQLRLDGIRLLRPEAWATCHTAAALWGLPVPAEPSTHVAYPTDRSRPRFRHLAAHVCTEPPARASLTTLRGRPLETPTATFVRMRAHLGLIDLVVLGDAVVRRCATSAADLRSAADLVTGRGSRHLRRAAASVRDRVDSPMETRLRLLLVLAGLPEPVVGYEIRDADGEPLFVFDLSYPRLRLAIEYDGAEHLRTRRRSKDDKRRERLDELGWRLVVVMADDLHGNPWGTLLRVHAALQERGAAVPGPSNGWRPHFC